MTLRSKPSAVENEAVRARPPRTQSRNSPRRPLDASAAPRTIGFTYQGPNNALLEKRTELWRRAMVGNALIVQAVREQGIG
jgi:hypothetical protein